MKGIPYILLVNSFRNDDEILEMVNKNWNMRVFVKTVKSANDAIEILKQSEDASDSDRPFLLLFDQKSPNKEEIETIRSIKDIPIVVTGQENDDQELAMLNLGVEDYIARQTDSRVCGARVQNVLRSWYQHIANSIDRKKTVGGLTIYYDQQKVEVNGKLIRITSLEFRILAMLMQNTGKVYSRTDLITEAWKHNVTIIKRSVDVHINRIRSKLGPVAAHYIETIHGCGYRFNTVKK